MQRSRFPALLVRKRLRTDPGLLGKDLVRSLWWDLEDDFPLGFLSRELTLVLPLGGVFDLDRDLRRKAGAAAYTSGSSSVTAGLPGELGLLVPVSPL